MAVETEEEEHIWAGCPSQILNVGQFLLWGIVSIGIIVAAIMLETPLVFVCLIIPIVILLWKALVVSTQKYEVTSQRLKFKYGILNKTTDTLELYRIKDYRLDQPFFLRIFKLGSIVLQTSDKSHPHFVIHAIKGADKLCDQLRDRIEYLREKRKVREIDFE